MIGLDTNVIVRYLTQDDDAQSAAASKLISNLNQDQPGYICSVVLAEICWVLSKSYKENRDDISDAVEGLLRSNDLVVENSEASYRALAVYRDSTSIDFADALIAETASLAGAEEIVTFDQKAAKQSMMRLLK